MASDRQDRILEGLHNMVSMVSMGSLEGAWVFISILGGPAAVAVAIMAITAAKSPETRVYILLVVGSFLAIWFHALDIERPEEPIAAPSMIERKLLDTDD